MKTNNVFLTMILTGVLTLAVLGQNAQNLKTKSIPKKNDVTTMMGKPVYESTEDSLRIKVWIISQKKNKEIMNTSKGEMMSKTKDKNVAMDKETKGSVMAGTHCIIIDVSNITNGKVAVDTSAKVEIVSPTKKLSSVSFVPMMSYFGGGVTLNEKGEYLFTINLNVGSSYKTSQFKYRLR